MQEAVYPEKYVRTLLKSLSYDELARNGQLEEEATAKGRVHEYTTYWQPPCYHALDQEFWYGFTSQVKV